jgi:hypothetical protein
MKKYLITYHGSQMPNDPEMMEKAKVAFGAWLREAGKSVIDPGAPTHTVSQVSNGNPPGQVEIGGYSIIEASSPDEVNKILKSHPFVSRGGTLQVNEVMAV